MSCLETFSLRWVRVVEEGQNRWAQWAELHAVLLEVMEELNYDKSPDVWTFTDSQTIRNGINGQVDGQGKRTSTESHSKPQIYENHSGIKGVH